MKALKGWCHWCLCRCRLVPVAVGDCKCHKGCVLCRQRLCCVAKLLLFAAFATAASTLPRLRAWEHESIWVWVWVGFVPKVTPIDLGWHHWYTLTFFKCALLITSRHLCVSGCVCVGQQQARRPQQPLCSSVSMAKVVAGAGKLLSLRMKANQCLLGHWSWFDPNNQSRSFEWRWRSMTMTMTAVAVEVEEDCWCASASQSLAWDAIPPQLATTLRTNVTFNVNGVGAMTLIWL